MKPGNHLEWLEQELPRWVAAGLLAPETAAKVRALYGPASAARGRPWLLMAFSVLGAFLVGAGLLLLLAHNWDDLPRWARCGVAFAPLLAAQALAAWRLRRTSNPAAWREGLAVFHALALGVCLALISQIYQVGGAWGNLLLTWLLLGLPVVYFQRSVAAGLLYEAGITIWAINQWDLGDRGPGWFVHPAAYWGWLLLLVPFLAWQVRRARHGAASAWLLWGLVVSLLSISGVFYGEWMEAGWLLAYAGLLGLLYLCGLAWFDRVAGAWRRPLTAAGMLGMLGMTVALAWRVVWESLGRHGRISLDDGFDGWGMVNALVLAAGALAYLVLLAWQLPRQPLARNLLAVMPVVTGAAYAAAADGQRAGAAVIIFNLYGLLVGLALVVAGARRVALGKLNLGMGLLCALIVTRFFDDDWSFLTRGLLFILCGVGFLAANFWLVRRRGKAA